MKQLFFSMIALLPLVSARDKLEVDNDHSTIGFAAPILHGLSEVHGKFDDFTVVINMDEADMTRSSVTATIKAASVDTNIAQRDRHLRTSDFFDVAKYPEITFVSKRIEKQGDHYIASGSFTLHGVTKEIQIPFRQTGSFTAPKFGAKYYGFEAHLKINRKDYGMNWMHVTSIPEWVGDVIDIDLHLFALKEIPKSSGSGRTAERR